MEFDEYVKSRAYRTLKPLSQYKQIDTNDLFGFQLSEGEGVIGIYENMPKEANKDILITTRGLHFKNNQQQGIFVSYDEIKSVEVLQPKEIANILTLHLDSGRDVELIINGKSGRFHDMWEFMRYVLRVVEFPRKS